MHPILFHLGHFPLHTYGALSALGFLLVVFVALRRARRLGVPSDHVVDVIFWSALAGVVGARGLWVLQNPAMVHGLSGAVNVRTGGLVFYGAVILGVPAAVLVMWVRRLPLLALCDVFATALPFGHAISRLGCFSAGCCYGTPTDGPLGVVFSHPLTDAPVGVALHPTQLYSAGLLVGIGVVVTLLYGRRRFDGQVILVYLGLYAVARFVVEFWRGDVRGWFLEPLLGQTLSLSQGIAVVVLAVVVVSWGVLARSGHRVTRGASPAA